MTDLEAAGCGGEEETIKYEECYVIQHCRGVDLTK
jgi:hypothetical protein